MRRMAHALARWSSTLPAGARPPPPASRAAAAAPTGGQRHASPSERWRAPASGRHGRVLSRHVHAAATPPRDSFFASQQDFEAAGLSPAVAAGLRAAGFDRPSAVQAAAARPILAGRDTVVAAQTGSGKTLAYLAPLVTRLLAERRREDGTSCLGLLVLTPNTALCDQVVATVTACWPGIVTAARVGGGGREGGLPKEPPDVTVATPAGLLTATGPGAPAPWSPDAVIARTAAVVIDEADALLGGGFARDTRRVLDALTAADAVAAAAEAAAWAGLGDDDAGVSALPLRERRAARAGGAAALAKEWGPAGVAARGLPPPPPRPPVRQYVFCGATLPEDPRMLDGPHGPPRASRRAQRDAPAGAWLRARWPRAAWVAGPTLHAPPGQVRLAWVGLADDGHGAAWAAALAAAVVPGERTLVFAATAAAVNDAVAALAAAGVRAAPYSSAEPPAARAAALAAFSGGRGDASTPPLSVLVATDAAARGLDVPAVAHVVQADMAPNAVDWLHRVGRTGRAGAPGRVTCLVPPASAPLAAALRASVDGGGAVDGAFSRKRSFRAKLKKYGEFVPRGEAGPARRRG